MRAHWSTTTLLFLLWAGSARADQAPIHIDSDFADWSVVSVAYVDPAGDSGGGQIDFGPVLVRR